MRLLTVGGGKTAMYHKANADGSISPVVDKLLFPECENHDFVY